MNGERTDPPADPITTFKELLASETSIKQSIKAVSARPVFEYLAAQVPPSPVLEDAFKDPVKTMKKFMAEHASRVQEDLVEFDGMILPRTAVSLAVASIFEYSNMIQRNFLELRSLDQRFKNQCPVPVLWGSEGMGKTTFALSVARKVRAAGPQAEGVVFSNLATFTEPDEVVGEINAAKMYARSQQLAFFLNLATSKAGDVPGDLVSSITRYDLSFENVALWDLTPLVVGAMAGVAVVGDEIGRMPPRALDGLMASNVATYSFGGHVVQARPGHFLICTANPKRAGDMHFTPDPAQQRRFILVDFTYDVPLESIASRLEGQRSAEVLREISELARERKIVLSPRQVFYFMRLAKYADESGDKKAYLHGLVNGLFSSTT